MEEKTVSEYREVIKACKDIFEKKTKDYGTAWRILRASSLTDQIFIKAKRIRSIQEKGSQKVEEDISGEFIAIINYCIMAIIQLDWKDETKLEIPYSELEPLYDKIAHDTMELLMNKNHDYGEAWRDMRVSSMTDIILMKILRTKQIEDNQGKTLISEGVDANYQDMINYSVFCLILMGFTQS
ncbi:DUF1599 domain-containing protein [Reichenbachiella ulvae]|uniref:DUF1599 domain-containing protein n=1 Tax=Reichenbachiella ulvae TaxID=2980104 RepID=A0ABT3CUK5_9BACT|nr:DUF1599 domain-containing protein [Reichenbachiella ulvae]MCV9387165.1 DUF1599 domain-containing protein [Reichenbachiella ulvae]